MVQNDTKLIIIIDNNIENLKKYSNTINTNP